MSASIQFTVFTKPWRETGIEALVDKIQALGFDGVELPVRPGYQVPPEAVTKLLPRAARAFESAELRIWSVAGPVDERTVRACGDAGVPYLRTMANVALDESYPQAEERLGREYDALLPVLEDSGVTLGVQNHCDRFVANAVGLRRLLARFDPRLVAAVWDAAHESLNGGLPAYALDVIWPQLCMVNLKNAIWQRSNGPEAEVAAWRHYWTDGRNGLAHWPTVIAELKQRGYAGVVCLTAEYSAEDLVEQLIARDLAWACDLFAQEG